MNGAYEGTEFTMKNIEYSWNYNSNKFELKRNGFAASSHNE